MRAGLYKVEKIENGIALLKEVNENDTQFTLRTSDFSHEVTSGDVVEVWQEGTEWKTAYREEETRSVKSHVKDFINRVKNAE